MLPVRMSRILIYSLKLSAFKFGHNALTIPSRIRPLTVHMNSFCTCNDKKPVNNFKSLMVYILDEKVKRRSPVSLSDIEDTIREVRASRFINGPQSLMLIRCCGRSLDEKDPKLRTMLAMDAWNTFQDLGVYLDIDHFNALLRVFQENEHQFEPADILAEIKKKGLEPNHVTCRRMISRYCQVDDITNAVRMFQYMFEKNMLIHLNVYKGLARYLSEGKAENQFKAAWKIVIQACIKKSGRSDSKKALENYIFMSDRSAYRVKSIFSMASMAGDIDVFEYFSNRIPEKLKSKIAFNNMKARAYNAANRVDELLAALENELTKLKTDEEVAMYVERFPRSAVLDIAIEKSEYLARIESLLVNSIKCGEIINYTGIHMRNCLWELYLIQKNYRKADELWIKFLENYSFTILYGSILKQIRKNKDVELATKLIDLIKDKSTAFPGTYVQANEALIDAYVYNNRVEDALECLRLVLKRIPLHELREQVLVELKNACDQNNISFPYGIPLFKKHEHSSGLSEDDSY